MKQYIVDAFTDQVFHGNQAAVCVLDEWLPDELMMDITKENNFSETAFTVKEADGYRLRWFTPGGEIDLCGHATLGTSYVLFNYYEPEADSITFHTLSGDLYIRRDADRIVMDFPAYRLNEVPVTKQMADAMGAEPCQAFMDRDLLLVYDDEDTVRGLAPDFEAAEKLEGLGIGVTAPGCGYDCVSRFFVPKLKVNEDPVTGSVHCMIAPYWAGRLGKKVINAYQASARGGELLCGIEDDRVTVAGKVALFSVSELYV